MNKYLLILLALAQTPDQRIQRDQLARDVSGGDTLAWARHITGLEQDDEFESVATIAGTGGETELWVVVNRTIDGNDFKFVEQFQPQDFGDQNDAWFVDGGIGPVNSSGRAEVPAGGTEATYNFTIISENGVIWYIPAGDGAMSISLDNGGVAVDVGGGVVGLPMADHPFAIDETIHISGTTNYNAGATLLAGTTADELRITAAYGAETFDGTEIVVKKLTGLPGGGGYMVQDDDGNLYYGSAWSVGKSTYITKIATDGTITYDDFTGGSWPVNGSTTSIIRGLVITDDQSTLYMIVSVPGPSELQYLQKYNLATGVLDWSVFAGYFGGYDTDVDADNNAYVAGVAGGFVGTDDLAKFDVADGAKTNFGTAASSSYAVVVNDNLSCVAMSVGARLTVRKLDDSSGATNVFGALIGRGNLFFIDDILYILESTNLHKVRIDFAGSDITGLTILATTVGPANATGMYEDIYGNLVVINQNWVTGQSEVMHYYDTDLVSLSSIDNMFTLMLRTWDSVAGGAWIQGSAFTDGDLSTVTDAVPGIDVNNIEVAHVPAGVELCVYADGTPIGTRTTIADANGTIVIDVNDTYDTVIAGINYYSVYESYLLAPKYTTIKDATIDFYETLGCHIGVSQALSTDLKFSFDDFATRQAMVTDWKYTPWLRGTTLDPRVYLWHWEPVPLTLRGLQLQMETRDE